MNRQGHYRSVLPDAPLVKVVGRIVGAEPEQDSFDEIDHVWIRIFAGEELIVSVNTFSKKNRMAGYDPRVRAGFCRGTWESLPPSGAEVCAVNDYAEIEARANVFFEHYDRQALQELLMQKCGEAFLLEAWGAPYRQRIQGVHQVHSRRASCAVTEDIKGRDGALKFYFESGRETELFLFKFCGQP